MPESGVVNQVALDALIRSPSGPVGADLFRRSLNVVKLASQLAPVGSKPDRRGGGSSLRGSIRILRFSVDGGGLYSDIGSDLPYAILVEGGTEAHIIKPKRKKALWWEGLEHPVPRVNHPGARAKPYLRPAVFAARN